ncbi:hypothetical protein ZWY2020_024962 [Hordeum vulgare]|nr:hypothetical protein ZWY2020_024962 [Hordeum vulgare]
MEQRQIERQQYAAAGDLGDLRRRASVAACLATANRVTGSGGPVGSSHRHLRYRSAGPVFPSPPVTRKSTQESAHPIKQHKSIL